MPAKLMKCFRRDARATTPRRIRAIAFSDLCPYEFIHGFNPVSISPSIQTKRDSGGNHATESKIFSGRSCRAGKGGPDRPLQPGPGKGPMPVHRAGREVEGSGNLR